jgi:transglutaminase-like putative cysteine protease
MTRLALALLAMLACAGAAAAHGRRFPYATLEDDLHYRVEADGLSVETHTLRVRVDTQDGVAPTRTQRLVFNGRYERVRVVRADILRPDGRRVAGARIRTVAGPVPGAEGLRDLRTLEVVFDGLAAGDTLRLVTRRTVPAPFFRRHFYAVIEPPAGAEDKVVSATVDLPRAMAPLHAVARGFVAARPEAAGGRVRYRWTDDGSANEREEYGAADRSRHRKGIWLSTLPGFGAKAAELAPHYRRHAVPDARLARRARAITAGLDDPRARVLAIQRWVQRNIRYRAEYAGLSAWLPTRDAAAILRAGEGDCKDHVVLMQALLEAAGIASTPALMHIAFDGYSVPAQANPAMFDHVLNYVPALDLYVDAANKEFTGGYLPTDRLDKFTLLLRDGATGHTPVQQDGASEHRLRIEVRADGSARFDYGVRTTGMEAGPARHWFATRAAVPPGAFGEALMRQHGWTGPASEDRGDVAGDAPDYRYAYHGEIGAFVPPGPGAELPAASALLPGVAQVADGFGAVPARSQAFMCEPHDVTELATYVLPRGFGFASVPADVRSDSAVLRFSATYRVDGDTLTIERHLRLNKAGAMVCTPADFEAMQPVLAAARTDLARTLVIQRR